MALSVLNNIASMTAQNNLAVTNNNLQNTLFQLSSGSRINSGADDPAGLSIADGLQANITALTQSAQNATNGVGQLQVADGALSQVTTLLNRAVTLSTEAANGGLTGSQFSAITNEYGSIVSEINRIGNATNFNGNAVFSSTTAPNLSQAVTTAQSSLNANEALTAGTTTSVQIGNAPAYTFTAGAAGATVLGSTSLAAQGVNTTIANGETLSVGNGNGGPVNFTAATQQYASPVPGGGALTNATGLTAGDTLTLTSTNGGTVNFKAQTLTETGAKGGLTNGTTTSAADNMTITTANGGTTTYTFTALDTMTQMLAALNANTATNGISAALNGAGQLVISGTAAGGSLSVSGYGGAGVAGALTGTKATVGSLITAINNSGDSAVTANINAAGGLTITSAAGDNLTVTQNAGSQTDLGTLAAKTDTVGDLINQINASNKGMTASINSNNVFQVVTSTGNLTVSNNTISPALGTVAVTNTVQDLINGINASGLGVTASLVNNVTNKNQLQTTITGNPVLAGNSAIAGTITLNSGAQGANGAYANTFSYVAGTTKDPITNSATGTVQGFIDSVNSSGTPFHAYLQNGQLEVTDSSYSGNVNATFTGVTMTAGLNAVTGFGNPTAATQLQISDPLNRSDLTVTNNDAVLGYVANTSSNPLQGGNADSFAAPGQTSGSGGASVFISDGNVTNPAYNTINVQVGLLNASQIGNNTTTLSTQNLGTASGAASALTVINSAISDVASMRGTIGAGINRLNSATNVINTQVQNLTSAQSSIQDANVGQVVASLSKYQILEQTGISALAQANQNQQAILKLLQ
jgi:flagellin